MMKKEEGIGGRGVKDDKDGGKVKKGLEYPVL